LALFRESNLWRGENFLGSETPLLETTNWANVVLVDDFIGSGRKVSGKIKWIRARAARKVRVYVTAFVAHEAAFDVVDPMVDGFHAHEYMAKGISDHYREPAERQAFVEAMKRVEGRFGSIGKKYSLGFEQTESTYFQLQWNAPNNVFPVFWETSHRQDEKFEPILARMPKR
jgi:hypothetical protein